jgi:GPH family glycoside/pentoside/hexuronide:cation symporter
MNEQIDGAASKVSELRRHLGERSQASSAQVEHDAELINLTDALGAKIASLRERTTSLANTPEAVIQEADSMINDTKRLKKQLPQTLFRLRLVEIGLPLALSIVSIFLTLRYPLTEARCYEIKEALRARHAQQAK